MAEELMDTTNLATARKSLTLLPYKDSGNWFLLFPDILVYTVSWNLSILNCCSRGNSLRFLWVCCIFNSWSMHNLICACFCLYTACLKHLTHAWKKFYQQSIFFSSSTSLFCFVLLCSYDTLYRPTVFFLEIIVIRETIPKMQRKKMRYQMDCLRYICYGIGWNKKEEFVFFCLSWEYVFQTSQFFTDLHLLANDCDSIAKHWFCGYK